MNEHQINELVSIAITLGSLLIAYLKMNAADSAQKEAKINDSMNDVLIKKIEEMTKGMNAFAAKKTKEEIKSAAEQIGVENKLSEKVMKLTRQTVAFKETE